MPDTLAFDEGRVNEIVTEHLGLEGPLLPIFHALNEEFGYVDEEAVPVNEGEAVPVCDIEPVPD